MSTCVTLTLIGNPKLVAGNTVQLEDCGRLSGKYLIESARHRRDRSSGYTTELEVKRVAGVQQGKGNAAAAKKKTSGKGLKVYGLKNGQIQVVGTTPQKSKKK